MANEPESRLLERYDELIGSLPAAPGWLRDLRTRALEHYRQSGLPHARVERWKYTNLNLLARAGFMPAALADVGLPAAVPDGALPLDDAYRLVLVNGALAPALCDLADLPSGVSVGGLADRIAADDGEVAARLGKVTERIADLGDYPLMALNLAHAADGYVVHLAEGTRLDRPIHVISVGASGADPVSFHPRNLIVAGPGSQATVVESHVGADPKSAYFSNGGTEVTLDDKATVQHYVLQDQAPEAFHIWALNAELGEGATFDSFVLQAGGRLARQELRCRLGARHGDARVNGAYVVRGEQHIDNTTFIDHAAPDCRSREVFKGVLDDRARAVFQGKILVRKPAQRTDGHQLNRALLLSRGAEVDSKPELEIYADDVKCSHGATVGELEELQLFYLMARGIDRARARAILIEAFLAEAVEEVENEAVRAAFAAHARGWLDGAA